MSQPNKRTRKRAARERRHELSMLREHLSQGADYLERAGWAPFRYDTVLMCAKLLRNWADERVRNS